MGNNQWQSSGEGMSEFYPYSRGEVQDKINTIRSSIVWFKREENRKLLVRLMEVIDNPFPEVGSDADEG